MTDEKIEVDVTVDAEVKTDEVEVVAEVKSDATVETEPEPVTESETDPVNESAPDAEAEKLAEPVITKAVATKKSTSKGGSRLVVTVVKDKGTVIAEVIRSYCAGRGDVAVERKGDKLTVTGDIPEGLAPLLDRYAYVEDLA